MGEVSFLHRLLVGDAPWAFLLEVLYRAAVIYLFLLVFMRLLGKVLTSQLGVAELAVLLMLGAAISAPIQVPTQGMLTALVVMACIVALQRGLAWWSVHSRAVEQAIQGKVQVMLEDGALALRKLDEVKISHETLMSQLRAQGIGHLGQLRRVYLEPGGQISVVRWQQARPGLSLYRARTIRSTPTLRSPICTRASIAVTCSHATREPGRSRRPASAAAGAAGGRR